MLDTFYVSPGRVRKLFLALEHIALHRESDRFLRPCDLNRLGFLERLLRFTCGNLHCDNPPMRFQQIWFEVVREKRTH